MGPRLAAGPKTLRTTNGEQIAFCALFSFVVNLIVSHAFQFARGLV